MCLYVPLFHHIIISNDKLFTGYLSDFTTGHKSDVNPPRDVLYWWHSHHHTGNTWFETTQKFRPGVEVGSLSRGFLSTRLSLPTQCLYWKWCNILRRCFLLLKVRIVTFCWWPEIEATTWVKFLDKAQPKNQVSGKSWVK